MLRGAHVPADPRAYGRYQLLFQLASGGMAEVWAARQVGEGGFERIVAVKRMHRHLADDDMFVRMFLDEGRLAAQIGSANVVPTLDLGRAPDGSLFLVMELVRGVSLARLLRRSQELEKPLPVAVAAAILVEAASGLHDAHEARSPAGTPLGIVHRDVSPQNVLVGADGRTRIVDFGVARAVQRLATTGDGGVKGKSAYFAPEQALAEVVDRRADVFALGIVAWEAFAGRWLFRGESLAETVARLLHAPVPPLASVREDVPAAVGAAVAQALERDRKDRFQTARAFASALKAAARSEGVLGDAEEVAAVVRALCAEDVAALETRLKESDERAVAHPPDRSASGTRVLAGAAGAGHPLLAGGPDLGPTEVSPAVPEADTQVSHVRRSSVPPDPGLVPAPAAETPVAAATAAQPARGSRVPRVAVLASVVVAVALIAAGIALVVSDGADLRPDAPARPSPAIDPPPRAAAGGTSVLGPPVAPGEAVRSEPGGSAGAEPAPAATASGGEQPADRTAPPDGVAVDPERPSAAAEATPPRVRRSRAAAGGARAGDEGVPVRGLSEFDRYEKSRDP